MKRLMIAMLLALPLAATAQDNTWEQTQTATQQNPDEKYLAGAVPEVNGKVTFVTTIQAPGKSSTDIYNIMLKELTALTKGPEQYEQSRISMEDAEKKQIVGTYQEQLIFKKKPLNFDFTRFMYHLIVNCSDGKAEVTMTRIYYLYDEERDAQTILAEEWINDRYGLNKKKSKLAKVSGKFRRKTIDRKDYLFEHFKQALNK